MSQQVINDTKKNMENAIHSFTRELASIRAGRANASLLDGVMVSYYGANTPLNQLAQISVPEARMIVITPYDKNILEDIEKAINKADIGITPSNDGTVIRLVVPQLTEERRREVAKQVGETAENGKVAIRNLRRSAMDELKKSEKDGDISEDELRRFEKEVQKLTDDAVKNIDTLAEEKEQEIISN
ncbi:MAG TPA: ribosome recycling factor [Atopostipes sp.]|nr:ribosome recycling factor [Atopostipes sp.]